MREIYLTEERTNVRLIENQDIVVLLDKLLHKQSFQSKIHTWVFPCSKKLNVNFTTKAFSCMEFNFLNLLYLKEEIYYIHSFDNPSDLMFI